METQIVKIEPKELDEVVSKSGLASKANIMLVQCANYIVENANKL